MAGHAGGVAGQLGDFFPHGELGVEVGLVKSNGHGRWAEGEADDVAGEEDAAMDGGGAAAGGE